MDRSDRNSIARGRRSRIERVLRAKIRIGNAEIEDLDVLTPDTDWRRRHRHRARRHEEPIVGELETLTVVAPIDSA